MSVESWDLYFLSIADAVAKKSKCEKRQVGAVIIDKHHRIVATGFNGKPRNTSCDTEACKRRNIPSGQDMHVHCSELHAEINALIYANFNEIQDGTLYCTHAPCEMCAIAILQSGVSRLVFYEDHRLEGVNLIIKLRQGFSMRSYAHPKDS